MEPYLLFRSRDGWYLEAYCLMADGQRTFKLERIRSARPVDTGFVPRPAVDLAVRQTGQAFSPDDVAIWAIVRFDPRWRTHLEDRGAHCEPGPDGSLKVRMPYLDDHWMAQEIIRYLGDAVLEHPASTRQLVGELASALALRYETACQTPSATGRAGGEA
ncbi:MAG: WYL domain-containing protein [bacterium]